MGTQESKPVQTTGKTPEVSTKGNTAAHKTGLRGAQTTTLFRVVNFELFVKPVSRCCRRVTLVEVNSNAFDH